MAIAPSNICRIGTPEEAADALERYFDREISVLAPAKHNQQPVKGTGREKRLDGMETSLCKIAKDLKLANPELRARSIRKELVRRIDFHRSSIARDCRYGLFIESGEHQSNRSDAWLCYVLALTNNKRKVGRRRGSKPTPDPTSARKEAIEQASTIKTRDQLLPVEQRAFDILKGDR
jgi:hypothetical protein